jgi:hypothetical protein
MLGNLSHTGCFVAVGRFIDIGSHKGPGASVRSNTHMWVIAV